MLSPTPAPPVAAKHGDTIVSSLGTTSAPLSLMTLVPLLDVVGRSGVAPAAEVLCHQLPALLAPHRAAPVELAVATGHHLGPPLLDPQTALSAQPPAAPPLPLREVLARLEALAALGAMVAQAGVPGAVVGRVLQEDQLRGVDVVEGLCRGPAAVGAVAGSHPPLVHLQLVGLVVFYLQVVPDLAELGELEPAGLDAAAPRHAVALAGSLHCGFHGLNGKGGGVRSSRASSFRSRNHSTSNSDGNGSKVACAQQHFRSFQDMS